MIRKVKVVPYDPAWPEMFAREADEIAEVFGPEVVAIHHIGSTSIPNLCAKPIVDVLVEVRDIERVDDFDDEMTERGYQPKGEFGIPGRRFFIKGGDATRTHHVHVFQTGHPDVERHLSFRDYMIRHPEDARAYGRLKEELAQKFPEDIEGYMAGKDGLIKEMDRKAAAWRAGSTGRR
jgi:GrpB-like predicted nucleotidyltransferase (UPF0157 family)